MSDTQDSQAKKTADKSAPKIKFAPLLPAVATISCLPYVVVYCKNLWQLSHYQFFPLILLVVSYLGYTRWKKGLMQASLLAKVLIPTSILACISGTLFASTWATYLAFVLALASWLGHQQDREGRGSLLYLAVPLLLIWQPPYSSTVTGDTVLIQQLQLISAKFASRLLDLLGYIHFQPGTVLEIAGRNFGVAEACSGIQSFFAVLSVGAILVVLQKRPLVHALLLLGTSPFWAVLMNTIRITVIPIAHANFQFDLATGLPHELLGYVTMAMAVGLMISTDELLAGLLHFLPEVSVSKYIPSAKLTFHGFVRRTATAACTFLLIVCSAIQIWDVQESWGSEQDTVDFFRQLKPFTLSMSDAPETLDGWPLIDYQQISRDHDVADLGERSNSWRYQAPFGSTSVSCDQLFPGWHELTRCYRNGGWDMESRRVVPGTSDDSWPMVEATFTQTGEHGYLLFCLANNAGRFLDPPAEWNQWSSLKERLQNRLTPAVRGTLFGVSAYQLQIFISSSRPLSTEEKIQIEDRFRMARTKLWQAAKQKNP